ncbi:MAG: hypothetical protein JWN70_5606 [Planctomycetaceae bacterium]|nr:hypothetical protein [Planctomycetaceae bacterium]
MNSLPFQSLYDCLAEFQQRFNAHTRVKKLVVNWDRSIVVEATDSASVATMMIKELHVTEVLSGAHPDTSNPIHLQAGESALIRIFSGDYNPAHALIEGDLAVFSSEKDKVKLEAITMVIWGL